MKFSFKNKIVFIAGGAAGIGLATAKMFAKAKAVTIIADINSTLLENALKTLKDKGEVFAYQCDISKEEEVKAMFEKIIAKFKRLDCAYNNVGVQVPVAEITEANGDEFDRAIKVNLKGMWNCLKYEMKQMKKQENGGSIVNCSSQCGLLAQAGLGAYTASKHGVLGLSKVAALEGARHKIRVNAICPGATDTPMIQQALKDYPTHMQKVISAIPLQRIAKPKEIASAILYLCHEKAGFITGEIMSIDGGSTLL